MKKVTKSLALAFLSAVLLFEAAGTAAVTVSAADYEAAAADILIDSQENETIIDETINDETPAGELIIGEEDSDEQPADDLTLLEEDEADAASSEDSKETSDEAAFADSAEDTDSAELTDVAANQVGENIFYTYNASTGVLTLTGTGATFNYTSYGDNKAPFMDLTGLKSIVIGEGITELGTYIFSYVGDHRGNWGTSVTNISFPKSLTTLHEYAFYHAYLDLCPLKVPSTITTIEKSALGGMLGDITLEEGRTTITPEIFSGATVAGVMTLPNSLETIEEYGLAHFGTHKDLTLPKNLKTIGDKAFETFTGPNIYFTSDLPTFGEDAFDSYSLDTGSHLYATHLGYYPADNKTWTDEAVASLRKRFGCIDFRSLNGKRENKCGENITWSYSNRTLTLTGSGPMYDYAPNHMAPWIDHRNDINTIKIDDRITSIGDYAFHEIRPITGTFNPIKLPSSLKRVGKAAFSELGSTTITFPEGLTEIDDYAFYYCVFLNYKEKTSYTFNKDMTYIGKYAFYYCNYAEFILPKFTKLTHIGERAFYGCKKMTGSLEFPSSLTHIGKEAFSTCESLSGSLHLPSKLTTLGEGAFRYCSGITGELVIPDSMTSIGSGAFYHTGITSVTMNDQVTELGSAAFSSCADLKKVKLSKNLTEIEYYTFNGCSSLTELDVPTPVSRFSMDAISASGIKKLYFHSDMPAFMIVGVKDLPANLEVHYPKNKPSWFRLTDAEKAKKMALTDLNPTFIGEGEAAKFTVTFKRLAIVQGGFLDEVFATQTVEAGACAKPVDTEFYGFNFIRMTYRDEKDKSQTYDFDTPIYYDVTVTVIYEPVKHTLTFYPRNGQEPQVLEETHSYRFYHDYNVKVPKRDGYVFLGWSSKEPKNGLLEPEVDLENIVVNSDLSFYAIWIKDPVTISFDTGCDVTVSPEKKYVYSIDATLDYLPTPYRMDADFGGWYYDKKLTEPATEDDHFRYEDDFTLYAKWNPIPCTVKIYLFVDGEAQLLSEETVYSGDKLKKPTETPSKEGYRFLFWYKPDRDLKAYDFDTPVTQDFELYGILLNIKENEDWGDIPDYIREDKGFQFAEMIPHEGWIYHSNSDYNYTGKKITLGDMKVFYYKTLLKEGKDYTVKYANNKNSGSATVTVTLKGKYKGTARTYFRIKGVDLWDEYEKGNLILGAEALYFNADGKKHKGKTSVKIKQDGKIVTLKNGKDFDFLYLDSDETYSVSAKDAYKVPGTYLVGIKGKGRYQGGLYITEYITDGKLMSKVKVKGLKNKTYDCGKEITQELTVKFGKDILTEGKDYVVEYRDNKEAGTATVILKPAEGSEYLGTKQLTFKISPASFKTKGFVSFVTKDSADAGSNVEAILAKETAPVVVIMETSNEKTGAKPEPTVYGREPDSSYKLLALNTDYKLKYGKKNKISITGMKNYKGTVSAHPQGD